MSMYECVCVYIYMYIYIYIYIYICDCGRGRGAQAARDRKAFPVTAASDSCLGGTFLMMLDCLCQSRVTKPSPGVMIRVWHVRYVEWH